MSIDQNNRIEKKLGQTPPYKIKKYLNGVAIEADAKRKYRWAILIYEKYNKKYLFNENFKYKLALFYDHLILFKTEKIRNTQKRKRLLRQYAEKAKEIYEDIYKHNPKYPLALRGLSRIYQILGDSKKALRFAILSYHLMKSLPKNQRGSLAVGNIYLTMGDFKNAEKWFKKELNYLGKNSLGANANLMICYLVNKQYKKALPYALRTEKLLIKELKNPIYNKFKNAKTNKTIKLLQKRIEIIKKESSSLQRALSKKNVRNATISHRSCSQAHRSRQ